MLNGVRWILTAAAAATIACGPAPQTAKDLPKPEADETAKPWYAQSAIQLAAANERIRGLLGAGKFKEAAVAISETQPLADKLLSVPRPTLEGMEAASDHDELYGRMLLHDGRAGWARMTFQKNLVRWRNWKPRTTETEARAKAAAAAVADCDRRM